MAAETLAWIDSTSTSHALDGSSVSNPRHVAGRQGFYAPPIAQLGQRTPLQPGEIIRFTDILPRVITVPLLIKDPGGSEANLQTQLEAMIETWFANPGTFRSTKPSGAQRDLNCYYLAGLELDENLDNGNRGAGWAYVTPQFEAADPFWYDTAATVNNYTEAQMLAGVTVVNNGAYLAYPQWQITGPFSALVITNTTTGLAIKLTNGTYSTSNGDTTFIDASLGTVNLDSGHINKIQFLTTDSILFPLAVGNNAITFGGTGFVSGQTTAQVSFKQRYRSL